MSTTRNHRDHDRRAPSHTALALSCAVLSAAVAGGCRSEDVAHPRAIYLIVVDTLRADRLSCYGSADDSTPAIDRLCKRGTRFDNVHSAGSWTIPSVASMMTSLYPTELGIGERPLNETDEMEWNARRDQRRMSIPAGAVTLAEQLRQAGFATAGFINQPGLNTGNGFMQGFDEWFVPVASHEVVSHDPSRPLPAQNWARLLTRSDVDDAALVSVFEEWIAAHGDRPVFVWLHLLTPHRPYDAWPDEESRPSRSMSPSNRYGLEIRVVDRLVGRILDAIDAATGLDRSLVVFTSDHGEAFGEHGMEEHGHSLHGEVTRVPLVLSGPEVPPAHAVDAPVSLIDLAPTILDLAGIEGDTGAFPRGSSLGGTFAGERSTVPIYSEAMLYGSTERSLIVGTHKLMYDAQGDRFSLYEIDRDRAEERDLVEHEPHRVAELKQRLSQLHTELERSAHAEELRSPATTEPDEAAMKDALRALGYVE